MRSGLFFRFFAVAGLTLSAPLVASSCTTTIILSPCDDDEVDCSGECVALSSNEDHCGGCGEACAAGETCSSGACVPAGECKPPLAECDGECVDLQTDPLNCGQCNFGCANSVCAFGECTSTCPPDLTECFGGCVDTSSDETHCGGCGNTCADGWQCLGSICTPTQTCDDPLCGFFCAWTDLPPATNFSVEGFNPFDQPSEYEPTCAGTQASESAFVFFAPESGLYSFDTNGSQIDTVLELRNGFCEPIGCNDDAIDLASQVVVELFAGDQIMLVVDGFEPGEFQLNGALVQDCPPNLSQCGGSCVDTLTDPSHCGNCFNDCGGGGTCVMGFCQSSCIVTTCGTCGGEVDLGSASPQVFDGFIDPFANGFQPICGDSFGSEVAHRFTAPTAGVYTFTASGMSDLTVSVLNDDCAETSCFPNATGTATLAAGQEVFVVVDGNFSGPYSLSISQPAPPTCPTGDLGNTVPVTISGSTVGSSSQFVPSCVNSNAPDHQYTFTPPFTGPYRVSTQGSSFDTVVHVLGGTCGGPSLGCNDDFMGSLQGQVTVNLTAGVPVTVVMDGFSGAGNYQLSVQFLGMIPPNP